jgi:hypothetical protein
MALPLLMKTLRPWLALVLVALALLGACGPFGSGSAKPSTAASSSRTNSSPTPTSNPTPPTMSNPLGVLVSPPNASNYYTVSLVGIDGRVIASAQASTPAAVTCANATPGNAPSPISISNSRAYYMDAQGVVRYLSFNGDAGRATTVPIGAARRSSFAVSPDDQRIAVIVMDFNANGANTRLYVEDLNAGAHHLDTFSDSGAYTLWATGWHGTNNLVVAKVPSCVPPTGGPLCCGPQEFHVVDPGTAFRRATVGGPPCLIAGPPSPAGAVCETATQANVLTWTGATAGSYEIAGQTPAYISPDGQRVALVSPSDPTTTLLPNKVTVAVVACGWIDNSHVLSGGDTQRQPRVADITTGKIVPVPAQGDCAGRIPGGL